jgi:hypothetical protein
MKRITRKLSVYWVFFITLFVTYNAKAAAKKDFISRVNTVRKALHQKDQSSGLTKEKPNEIRLNVEQSKGLSKWVNWGNWNNWANWNNWNNWAKWNNWRNF